MNSVGRIAESLEEFQSLRFTERDGYLKIIMQSFGALPTSEVRRLRDQLNEAIIQVTEGWYNEYRLKMIDAMSNDRFCHPKD
ncbi:hypothetical protein KOR42_32930 [Thalassoglobus neptunius]|uniref:Uncharacterized protein n=1 Tax=Thalassoglobus neptunius TaxID=1938619 RepID=A0A5C5WMI0_9PLAN|nr:hypothetical protein KOR42_32930 [Thalassoglobus neptunius]